jgi:hypothetical protein
LRKRGIPHTIPQRRDRRGEGKKRPGRPPSFEKSVYRRRNVVEWCVKQAQAVAGDSDALRETGGQLSCGGRDRLAHDLAGIMNHQTDPNQHQLASPLSQ